MGIRIMIVDDHAIVRDGLRALLAQEPDMEVVAEAESGLTAAQRAREVLPDVVVMDIHMPDMNGIEATRLITSELSEVKVLALSMEPDRRYVVEMLRAGAKGYVLKESNLGDLAVAIRTVADGEPFLCARISAMIIKDYMLNIPEGVPLDQTLLSAQEREIIKQVADGKNTKDIAYSLGVTARTVETQRHVIMKKLDLYSVASLTKYAVRKGLTSIS
jgi:DNA-binding NarL/FixJ family response regulator